MKAYSLDLRQRIVKAVLNGQSKRQVAQTFAVSYSTVKRLVKQYQTTDSLAPKVRPGRTRQIQAAHHELLKSQWQRQPDAKLEWHCEEWTREVAPLSWSIEREAAILTMKGNSDRNQTKTTYLHG
jgi:transposase